MNCPLDQEALEKLKGFINICKQNTDILHIPALSFFKEFIETFGGSIPSSTMPKDTFNEGTKKKTELEEESESESDLEIDSQGCVDPDKLEDIEMGKQEVKELTEEECDKVQELRHKAMEQFNEGNFDKSIEIFSDAIAIDPSSALFFAKRGQAHLKLNKPNACIRDCSKALELNPDSAAAYKFRGRAYRLLGQWENAAEDLRQACKIDFDEQSDEWLKEVTPNANKIKQYRLKQERKRLEKEEKEKLERLRKAKEARAKASQENQQQYSVPPTSRMPGMGSSGTPGMGASGMPGVGGAGMGDFYKLLQDPEVMGYLQDPDVAAAFQDISSNPANFIKYQSNPKIMALIAKLSSKMNLSGGMGGGFPGGMPGAFPGAFNPSQNTTPQFQDDNLD